MIIIGIAGGSGSGKTTFAKALSEELGHDRVGCLYQDSYYIDRSKEFKGDGSLNFDHPDAVDWDLMSRHLRLLISGESIQQPIYDFATHKRKAESIKVQPKEYVILDGILLLSIPKIRELIDIALYVDCEEPERFRRRLFRDTHERGRTEEGVRAQYGATVLPMHEQFVEPSKLYADYIVDGQGDLLKQVKSFCQDLSENKDRLL